MDTNWINVRFREPTDDGNLLGLDHYVQMPWSKRRLMMMDREVVADVGGWQRDVPLSWNYPSSPRRYGTPVTTSLGLCRGMKAGTTAVADCIAWWLGGSGWESSMGGKKMIYSGDPTEQILKLHCLSGSTTQYQAKIRQ